MKATVTSGIAGQDGAYLKERAEHVFLAACVGGIYANNTCRPSSSGRTWRTRPMSVHEAWRTGVKRLRFPV